MKIIAFCAMAMLLGCLLGVRAWADANEQKAPRPVVITLRTGEKLRGDLVKVDDEVVEFTVRATPQAVRLDDVAAIEFPVAGQAGGSEQTVYEAKSPGVTKPVILYKEKARYTKEARESGVFGTVVLSVVFAADARVTGIRVIRGLPQGLTESAIEAAQKIKFQPATKDGKPVNFRATLEFTFNPD